jgi:hypothetical protein
MRPEVHAQKKSICCMGTGLMYTSCNQWHCNQAHTASCASCVTCSSCQLPHLLELAISGRHAHLPALMHPLVHTGRASLLG